MGSNSAIQWTTHTWNPWRGCTKVSPGCAHCYMYRDQIRYGRNPAEVVRSADATFFRPLRDRKWQAGDRVFTCSWSDFFHEDADPWREEAWEIIRQTPHLTYQILTKRPERIKDHLPRDWGEDGYDNVWLGVSAEYHRQAAERIPRLVAVPAAAYFVSAEPLLGRLDLHRVPDADLIDWWIVGGESGGREARPLDLAWVHEVVAFARQELAAPFVKQLGTVWAREHKAKDWHGGDWSEWPDDLRVREFPLTAERTVAA